MKTQFIISQGIYTAFNDQLIAQTHGHQFIQINLLKPNARVLINQQKLSAQCVLIDSHIKHSLTSPEHPVITMLIDNFSALGKSLSHLIAKHSPNSGFLITDDVESSPLWQFFEQQQSCFSSALEVLLASLCCHHKLKFEPQDQRITRALSLLNKQNTNSITLTDLAQHSHLSNSRFSHLFSQELGMPLKSYLRYLRFQRVLPLLAKGGDLTEAAYNAGFSDAAHFSRECRKLFGVQPKLLKGKLTLEQL